MSIPFRNYFSQKEVKPMKQFPDKVAAYIERHQLLASGDHVLIACSGGVDSTALLAFFKQHKQRFGIRISAAHVNHMLRGEESAEDRRFTERLCSEWGIPVWSRDIPIPEILAQRGGNKQQVCREERYGFFEEVMASSGATKLAVAHHADDQLETILLSAVRGTLTAGISGMPIRRPLASGELVRPFLAVSKEEISVYAAQERIPFREDPSNAEPLYTRNRLRHTLIPLLKEENEGIAGQMAEFAEGMREDQLFLEHLADEKVQALLTAETGGFSLSAEAFRQEALALQKRMVLLLLKYLYCKGSAAFTKGLAEQVQEMMQCSTGTVFLHLPENGKVTRRYDRVFFTREAPGAAEASETTALSGVWSGERRGRRYKALLLEGEELGQDGAVWFFSAPETARVVMRSRQPGDRIQLPGMKQPKKVARLMIDEKVPLPERENWPVIALEDGKILLIPGLRASVHVSRKKRARDNWALIEQSLENRQAD